MIIDDGRGTQTLNEGGVLARRGGHNFQSRSHGELHGGRADGRRTSPDDQDMIEGLFGCRQGWVGQGEEIGLVEAGCSGGDGEWEDNAVFVGQG